MEKQKVGQEMLNELVIKNLSKSFPVNGEKVSVLENINLSIKDGEFVVIVGHSGCGKSTLLKIIAGLETQEEGICNLNGKAITRPGFDRGMIFQEHRLFPWLTIGKNIQVGLGNHSKGEKEKITNQYLDMVKLSDFKHAYPSQLSGGMSQRAAIARALAPRPEILLLDEPFGALDALTKVELQEEILKIRTQEKSTMIMVTHDIDEAVFLADRVVVMSSRPGKIKDIISIELDTVRNRGNSDFAWYKSKIYRYFFESREKTPEFII